jgi:hypothetical protein
MCATSNESANSYNAVTLATLLDIGLGEKTRHLSDVVPSVLSSCVKAATPRFKTQTCLIKIRFRAQVLKLRHP